MTKDEATANLLRLKAICHAACDGAEDAVKTIPADAIKAAVVAHHVGQHGENSLTVALAAGPFKFLDEQHIAEVGRVQAAVTGGQDPAEAAGADPAHVALLEAARTAHADHGDELAQAYADFAAAD